MAAHRFTLLRHAQSEYNARGVLNGDPRVAVALTEKGRQQAMAAGRLLSHLTFDLAVHTRFQRTSETLDLVLRDREVPREVYAEFDDLSVGDFEGKPLAEYREWRSGNGPDDAPPGGESRISGLRRYIAGYERLLASGADRVVAVLHDVPIRFLKNALHDTDPIAGPHQSIPNADPMTVTDDDLTRAITRMRERARG